MLNASAKSSVTDFLSICGDELTIAFVFLLAGSFPLIFFVCSLFFVSTEFVRPSTNVGQLWEVFVEF